MGDGARDRFPYAGNAPGLGDGARDRGAYIPGAPPPIGLGEGALERDKIACSGWPPRYGEGARCMSAPGPADG